MHSLEHVIWCAANLCELRIQQRIAVAQLAQFELRHHLPSLCGDPSFSADTNELLVKRDTH